MEIDYLAHRTVASGPFRSTAVPTSQIHGSTHVSSISTHTSTHRQSGTRGWEKVTHSQANFPRPVIATLDFYARKFSAKYPAKCIFPNS